MTFCRHDVHCSTLGWHYVIGELELTRNTVRDVLSTQRRVISLSDTLPILDIRQPSQIIYTVQ